MVAFTVIFVARDALLLYRNEQLMRDAIGYWLAGEHVLAGDPLYYDVGEPFGSEVFLFAPWFAWAWAPITLLPRELVFTVWTLGMLTATVWAVRPFFSKGLTGAALGCLLAYGLAWGALWANVMPMLVGVLIHTFGRRSFPVWVGLAASLKVLPILYLWPYAAKGRWRPVAIGAGLMVVLWAPALLYGLFDYPRAYSATLSLLQVSGWLWALVAAAAAITAVVARHTPYQWLATSFAIIALYPRLHLHYLGLLGVGYGHQADHSAAPRTDKLGTSR